MSEDEPLSGQTYQRRYQAQIRKEVEEADQEWIRKQKLLDHLWQAKLDDEAPLDDGYVDIGGFRERRTRYGFTKHWRDADFDAH